MNDSISKKPYIVFLAFLNLASYLAMVIVNALANILPINNRTTGELSDKYPNLFVPAGITFSIWGLIYLLLAIFVIYMLVLAFKKSSSQSVIFNKISLLFFFSSLFNIGWIFTWHYEIVWLSLIFMLLLFVSLLAIYLRLNIGKSVAGNLEKSMAHIPFSVYIGWITIATIANVTALLVDAGWNRFGLSEQFWTVLVIVVGIIIALAIAFSRNDIFYCLVVDWSLLGILIKRMADKQASGQSVIIAAIVGIALVTVAIIVQLLRRRKLY